MRVSAIGVIIATHGHLAEVLVETAELILGRKSALVPFTFPEQEKPKDSLRRLQAQVKKCDKGSGVIILADLFGGTPGSLALSMLDEKQVEVATGVNLPMVLTAATLDPKYDLRQAGAAIVEAGKKAIKEAAKILWE